MLRSLADWLGLVAPLAVAAAALVWAGLLAFAEEASLADTLRALGEAPGPGGGRFELHRALHLGRLALLVLGTVAAMGAVDLTGRSVPQTAIAAATPRSALTTVMLACIASENDTTAVADAVWLSATASMTCCVPAPPGVSGTTVDAPPITMTSAASATVAGKPNAASKHNTTPTRQHQAASCGSATLRR